MSSATLDIYARTIWGEAHGDGLAGMAALAAVINNRVARPGWWGKDVPTVCRALPCWNLSNAALAALLTVDQLNRDFADATDIAMRAIAGSLGDPTNGADSYYTSAGVRPAWARGLAPLAIIGRRIFVRVQP